MDEIFFSFSERCPIYISNKSLEQKRKSIFNYLYDLIQPKYSIYGNKEEKSFGGSIYGHGIYGKKEESSFGGGIYGGGIYGKKEESSFGGGIYGKKKESSFGGGIYCKKEESSFGGGISEKKVENSSNKNMNGDDISDFKREEKTSNIEKESISEENKKEIMNNKNEIIKKSDSNQNKEKSLFYESTIPTNVEKQKVGNDSGELNDPKNLLLILVLL